MELMMELTYGNKFINYNPCCSQSVCNKYLNILPIHCQYFHIYRLWDCHTDDKDPTIKIRNGQ